MRMPLSDLLASRTSSLHPASELDVLQTVHDALHGMLAARKDVVHDKQVTASLREWPAMQGHLKGSRAAWAALLDSCMTIVCEGGCQVRSSQCQWPIEHSQ